MCSKPPLPTVFKNTKRRTRNLEWVWKHHGCVHLADMLRRFKFLLALFTHERRHRLIKRFLHGRMNLQSFERGVLEELTCDHLRHLKTGWLRSGLSTVRAAARSRTQKCASCIPTPFPSTYPATRIYPKWAPCMLETLRSCRCTTDAKFVKSGFIFRWTKTNHIL